MLGLKSERFGLRDHESQPIALCGKTFTADRTGALFWPAGRTLIVADLHLEKGSASAARGRMLPPYDTRETLLKLAATIDRTGAERIIALGDSFHDTRAATRMSVEDREILEIIQDDREWIWVTGNHDPSIPAALGGEVVKEIAIEGISLRHEPTAARVTHEIAGHLHPAAKLSVYGASLRRPCFIGNGRRLVMPAFGAFTGGLNVVDDAFQPLFGSDGFAVWMMGEEGLYPVPARRLVPDRG